MTRLLFAVPLLSLCLACGSSEPTPTDAGSGGGGGGGGGGDAGQSNPCQSDAGLVITFTSTGVSPKNATVDAGTRVLVRNDDTQSHQLASEPHPSHTTCPQVNTAVLQGGQCEVRTLAQAGDCSFHDHTRPADSAFSGTLTVQ